MLSFHYRCAILVASSKDSDDNLKSTVIPHDNSCTGISMDLCNALCFHALGSFV